MTSEYLMTTILQDNATDDIPLALCVTTSTSYGYPAYGSRRSIARLKKLSADSMLVFLWLTQTDICRSLSHFHL